MATIRRVTPPGAPTRRWLAAAVALLVSAAACSGGSSAEGSTPSTPSSPSRPAGEPAAPWTYPGEDWERADAAAAGFDPAALDRLAARADAAGSSCTVVTRDGVVVDERSWDGADTSTVRQAWSVTKSLTSLLVGIAQDEGSLAVTDRASAYIPEWQGTPSEEVTIEDLLSNVSGRHWDAGTDYGRMAIAEPDKTAFAIGLGQDAPPGEVWAYNNSGVQTLSAVLEAATGEDPADYARTRVFDPVGMGSSSLSKDPSGGTMTFAGLRSTCLDLARFGYLALRDGTWAGDQVVPADYVRRATRASSQELNAAYGWLWWNNHPGPVTTPLIATAGRSEPGTAEGPLLPGAPEDVFWALGFQNQIVAVVPSEGIVAVRMGPAPPAGTRFDQAVFTQGVLDALVGS